MRKFAVVTGASSGIGLELARIAAGEGYDLLVAADTPFDGDAATLDEHGVAVTKVECDLSTEAGVRQLLDAAGGRAIDVLVANAGQSLGHGFLDQSPAGWRKVLDTNVTGTLLLLHPVLKAMVARGAGRVLVTGSIAGHVAGSFQAVYTGTKAFLNNFAAAIADELKDSGVTITCLKPGATESAIFARADMLDTRIARSKKADPADTARTGWDAMMKGEREVVDGWLNKAQVIGSGLVPESVTAAAHRFLAEPGHAAD